MKVRSIRTPMLIQEKLERTETNLIHFERTGKNHIFQMVQRVNSHFEKNMFICKD